MILIKERKNMKKILAAIVVSAISMSAFAHDLHSSTHSTVGTNQTPRETITPAFNYPIANVKGKNMTAIVVDYPAGGTTPAHRHGQAFVVGYVLQGAIKSRLNNGVEKVYHAGESWTEEPGAHHNVSENASKTEPAKLLAIFVTDENQKDLVKLDKK